MKKINAKFNNKDRIICTAVDGSNEFYYQPAGTKQRFWLFKTKRFSGSVFSFFRKHGRNLDGLGFSLTIKEIYELGRSRNCKLSKIMELIPIHTEYVIRNICSNEKTNIAVQENNLITIYFEDYKCAA